MAELTLDREYHAKGIQLLCGVDEAGRGPLAGPVFAAAVILPDAGFFTDRICPEISASTSLYSKASSHPSVVQFTRVSPLQ